jgi:bacterioferritin-associated ferredoxin
MYVCLCHGVTSGTISRAVPAATDSARHHRRYWVT